ncbi:MobV family relaxase [Klebsiella michiganensis]|uniref:MobV family relaxase n=1 Tax=Klebsiella michiganensis TaxID=1134687 RepID=UPI000B32BC15|nr:MobV family relaxase [Klebsiella michiganensis]
MAAFAIMRCKKLSGIGSVAASLKHCFRERDTPNADPERLRHNMHMAARSTDEAMGKLREKLPEKRRKDAVLAIEYVLSASPEWWINADSGRKTDFYQSSMDWLAEKYGRENILVSSIHLDEKTPHMSAFVVPITKDGRVERQGVHRQPHQDEQRPEQLCRGRQAPWTGAGHRGQQGDPQAHQGPLQRAGAANPRASRDPRISSRKASKARGCWARSG